MSYYLLTQQYPVYGDSNPQRGMAVRNPHIQRVSGRMFGGYPINTVPPHEHPRIMVQYGAGERNLLPQPITVVLGSPEVLSANPGRVISAAEPEINIFRRQATATPCRELAADSNVKPVVKPESLVGQTVLNPDAPAFIPEADNLVQDMPACASKNHDPLEAVIDEIKNIALCLIDNWHRNLNKDEMKLVTSFPEVWSRLIELLKHEDQTLNGESLSDKAKTALTGLLGTPEHARKGSMSARFSESEFKVHNGRYRNRQGQSMSTYVLRVKKLIADHRSVTEAVAFRKT